MTELTNPPITFSPTLRTDDNCVAYWFQQVTLRLRREICWCWRERGMEQNSEFLDNASLPPFVDKTISALNMSRYYEEKMRFLMNDKTARYLTEQLLAVPPPPDPNIRGSFCWLVNKLNLDHVSSFVLSLGLATFFDSAVESVVSACMNDHTKTQPNFALAQKLWDHPEQIYLLTDPGHDLFRLGLLQHGEQHANNYSEINLESPIKVPPLVANQLIFPHGQLPMVLHPIGYDKKDFVITDVMSLLVARLRSEHDVLRIVPIVGQKNSSYTELVRGISKVTNRNVVEFKGDPRLLEDNHYLNSLATLCWLRNLDLYLGPDLVSALQGDKQTLDAHILPLQSIPITIFLGVKEQSQLANIPSNLLLPAVEIPRLSYDDRVALWEKSLGKKAKGLDSAIAECSRRFRFEKVTINNICKGLQELSSPITEKDLVNGCRAELELNLGELAQKVNPRFEFEELILPTKQYLQFQEIIKAMKSLTDVHYGWGTAKAWDEGGISVLFAGPPGSGKTMAAELLATKLDLPMYKIDLSQVVNKYIGETQKNLKRLFDVADICDIILFFDEADSLFGHRTEVKDAHDRYANLEINYLLERMERFKGLAILATNRKNDLDEAFLRRLRYILDFPIPGEQQRKKIWLQCIPKSIDSSQIDYNFLARQFQLTGGNIRSIVFNACLQSVRDSNFSHKEIKDQLTMKAIIVAVRREYEKINRLITLEQFGPYAEIVQEMERE